MKKNNVKIILILFFIAINAKSYEFGGFYKNYSQFLKSEIPNEKDIFLSSNKIRLKFSSNINENIKFEIANEFTPVFHNKNFTSSFTESLYSYRVGDFDNLIYPSSIDKSNNLSVFNNLDRFVFVFQGEATDVYFGRQAIAFGSAMVVNPTDIFTPFTFNSLDKEERVGVDAIRIRRSFGDFNELDVGFVGGKNLKEENNSYYLRSKIYVKNTDLTAIYINYRKNKLYGLNIEKSLFGAKVYFEGAYVKPENENYEIKKEDYSRISIGFDRQITANINIFSEFHYNGAGESKSLNYNQLKLTNAYNEGSVYLLGKNYLSLGSSVVISPLTSFNTIIMYNLNDNSMYLTGNFEYNIKEDVYLSCGINYGIGKEAKFENNQLNYNSEFGSYPNLFYVAVRYYF